MTRQRLVVPPAVRRAIVAHARRMRPLECCGLLVGRQHTVLFAVPMANVARSPVRYRVDDREHIALRRILRTAVPALAILGVYHSHPAGDATPSPTDIEQAYYPDWTYVIVGLGRSRALLRGYRLQGGRAAAVALK